MLIVDLPNQERHTATSTSGYILALYGGISLVALLISAGRGDVDLFPFDRSETAFPLLSNIGIGIGIGAFVVFMSRLATTYCQWAQKLHEGFRAVVGELTRNEILVLALASSVGEELFFRGALQPWIGIWPQALLFGGLHLGPGKQFRPWTLSAFGVGIGFGYLTVWTGDLAAPMLAHFIINYFNLQFIVRKSFSG